MLDLVADISLAVPAKAIDKILDRIENPKEPTQALRDLMKE